MSTDKNNPRIHVLFLCHTPVHLGGAALSLLNLIHAVNGEVFPVVVFPKEGPVCDLFRREGIACCIVPFPLTSLPDVSGRSWFERLKRVRRRMLVASENRKAVKELGRLADEYDIQVVHSNSGVFTAGYETARRKGLAHVWHLREFQDLDFGWRPVVGWRRLKKKIASSDAVVSITRAVAAHFGMAGRPNGHVLWDAVKSCCDVAPIDYRKEKFFFFCSAILCESKGVSLAVEAFARSGLAAGRYRLVMAGETIDTALMHKLQALAQREGIDGSIDYVGYCSDVTPYFKKAAGFLMCSESEGMGRVTVEAMFHGCPVMARRTGGSQEIVDDGKNGLLFDTAEDCARLMREVATRNTTQLIDTARAFAMQHFTEESYGRPMVGIYRKITQN